MAKHKPNPLYLAVLAGIGSLNAHAVGLGGITVHSALNQPLRAEVPMIKLTQEEADSARVFIRPLEDGAAGSTNSSVVARLSGEFVPYGAGRYTLRITSRDNIREPVLNFFVEIVLPNAHARRDFTVLLDPPGGAMAFVPADDAKVSASADFVAMEHSIAELAAAPGANHDRSKRAPSLPSRTTESRLVTNPAPALAAPERKTGTLENGNYGPVMKGETLWAIAQRVRPREISVPEMMEHLLAANPEAFVDNDIDRLKAGVTLRMPGVDVTSQEASAGVATPSLTDAGGKGAAASQTVLPEPSAMRGVPSAPAPDTLDENRPAATTAGASQPATESLQERVDLLTTQIVELQVLMNERNARITALETELQALRAKADLLPLAGTAVPTAAGADPVTTISLAPAADAALSVQPAAPVTLPSVSMESAVAAENAATTTVAEGTTAQEPLSTSVPAVTSSLGDDETSGTAWHSSAIHWTFGSVTLIALLAVHYVRRRNLNKDAQPQQAADDRQLRRQQFEQRLAEISKKAQQSISTARAQSCVVEEETTPDWNLVDADAPSAAPRPVEPKPVPRIVPLRSDASQFEPLLKEVDLQLAYLQYEDAEKLVSDALKESPNEITLLIKLAEVHAAAGNVDRFVDLAEILSKVPECRDNHSSWARIARLGEALAPRHPLFICAATVELSPEEIGTIVSRA